MRRRDGPRIVAGRLAPRSRRAGGYGGASRPPTSWILVVAAAVLLAACAAPKPDIEWRSPELAQQPNLLRGANVLVACEAPDVAVRNVCQERLAGALAARGATPVFVAADTRLVADRALDEQLLPSARQSSAAAILVMSLRPAASETDSPFSLSIGGFGFGRSSAVGGGIAAPVGGTRVATAYAANGRVTSVASGRLVYTATATAPISDDLPGQLSSLSASVLDAAQRAGLL